MRTHTRRELRAWMAWMERDLSRPDRTAYYLMQVAAEVRRGHVKHPERVKVSDLYLNFEGKNSKTASQPQTQSQAARQVSRPQIDAYSESQTAEDREQQAKARASAISRSVWMARLGMTKAKFTESPGGKDRQEGVSDGKPDAGGIGKNPDPAHRRQRRVY